MRIFSYQGRRGKGVGVMAGDTRFVALAEAAPDLPGSLKPILELPDGLARARRAADGKPGEHDISEIVFLPPIEEPNAIWALALNFKLHIQETGLTTSDKYPHLFMRHAGSLVGHGQALRCPPFDVSHEHDYEGELAVVIGKGGRHIPVEKALDHVAGYCPFNEGSVREFQRHNRNFGLGKNFEESGSIGPWIMTPDESGDIAKQYVITRLNGVERQKSTLSDMLFTVEQVIHYLSTGYRLRSGDIIAMGTPGALPKPAGEAHDPDRQRGRHKVEGKLSMRPGDRCEVEITGVGVLGNPIAADEPVAYRVG
jgi:2-keto-4-pentenoate hydratase/2-oxohepta-3-ene-1,7-dioic acid hydratase in catechol pathway